MDLIFIDWGNKESFSSAHQRDDKVIPTLEALDYPVNSAESFCCTLLALLPRLQCYPSLVSAV